MAMMDAGMMAPAQRTPMAGMDDRDGDVDTLVHCPECGAEFAPGDADNDAMALSQGRPAGAPPVAPEGPGPVLATPAPAPMTEGDKCAECGGAMEGGKCMRCGYSKGNSPMRKAAESYAGTRPEGERPNIDKVVEQGSRVRQRMQRPAPFGRA